MPPLTCAQCRLCKNGQNGKSHNLSGRSGPQLANMVNQPLMPDGLTWLR